MRYLRCIIAVALVIFSLAFCASVVSADEIETDWTNYDWENFSIKEVEYEEWESMCDWFRTEADLDLLFFIRSKTDASYSTDLSCILADRFFEDPQTMLFAIANEEEEEWSDLAGSIVYGADNWDELPEYLENLRLSGPDAEKGYAVLAEMIVWAEELLGVDITNPKTGDPVGVAVAVMVLCGFGGGALLRHRRKLIA